MLQSAVALRVAGGRGQGPDRGAGRGPGSRYETDGRVGGYGGTGFGGWGDGERRGIGDLRRGLRNEANLVLGY